MAAKQHRDDERRAKRPRVEEEKEEGQGRGRDAPQEAKEGAGSEAAAAGTASSAPAEETHPRELGLCISFTLPRSSYATVFLVRNQLPQCWANRESNWRLSPELTLPSRLFPPLSFARRLPLLCSVSS